MNWLFQLHVTQPVAHAIGALGRMGRIGRFPSDTVARILRTPGPALFARWGKSSVLRLAAHSRRRNRPASPALSLGVAWMSELWAHQVTGEIPMATVTGVGLTRRSMFFDPAASLAELGLKPRPIHESARDAVAW